MIALLVLALAQPTGEQPCPAVGAGDPGKAAVTLREQGRDAEARTLLRCALQARAGDARLLALLSQTEQALGLFAEAEVDLREALAHSDNPYIQGNRPALERALENLEDRLGSIELTGGVDGAEVIVNGTPAGRLPLAHPVRVPPGVVALEVQAPGHAHLFREVRVTAKQTSREVVTLVPLPSTAQPPPPRAPEPTPEHAARAIAPPPPSPDGASGRFRRGLGWTLGAAAIAGTGVGVAFHMLRQGRADDFNRPGNGCGKSLLAKGAPGCQDLYDDVERDTRFMLVGYGAGLLLAGAAAFLLVTPPEESSVRGHTALSWSCRPNLVLATCIARF